MEQVLNDSQSYLYALIHAPFYDIYHLGHHLLSRAVCPQQPEDMLSGI